jgi:hypothetical protein
MATPSHSFETTGNIRVLCQVLSSCACVYGVRVKLLNINCLIYTFMWQPTLLNREFCGGCNNFHECFTQIYHFNAEGQWSTFTPDYGNKNILLHKILLIYLVQENQGIYGQSQCGRQSKKAVSVKFDIKHTHTHTLMKDSLVLCLSTCSLSKLW